MTEEKKKNIIIVLLSIIAISLLILVIMLATKTQTNNENNETNDKITETQNNNITNENKNEITSKLLTLDCENSNETFNNITINIKQKNDNGMCVLDSILINNKEIKNNIATYIKSYEFYNDNIIIFNADTSNKKITIYNTTNESSKDYTTNNLSGYKVDSYYTKDNKIIINGKECGAQCGNPDTEYKKAIFEIEYLNNAFTEPKLIEKTK